MRRPRIPTDLAALLVIAVVMFITHQPLIVKGMSWCDPSWFFHFGNRTLHGAVPYRDYVFSLGPFPIYLDAGFQDIFGESYLASLYAALFIKILRVWVYWLLVRRLVNTRAAVLFAVYAALDNSMSWWAHHWGSTDAQLFFTTAGLCIVLATDAVRDRRPERLVWTYLAMAGFFAALVVSGRQPSFVMQSLVLGVCTVIMVYRQQLTRARFVALWGGWATALLLVAGLLALQGALGPAIQQMFLEAAQKKNVSGLHGVLDALSGGALVSDGPRWDRSWWGGVLFFLGLPLALTTVAMLAVSRAKMLSSRTLAMLAVPTAIVVGLLLRDGELNPYSDVPRYIFSVTTVLAVLWPERLRQWFGIEPLVALGLGAIPLASDWALELSLPGRGWGDAPSLTPGVFLFALASTRLAPRIRTGLCAALAVCGVLAYLVPIARGITPFETSENTDGTLAQNRFHIDDPVFDGIEVSAHRARLVPWLQASIPRGSTCFVYGVIPVMYEIVGCRNPTHMDVTGTDFIAASDAENAIAALRANPPDYIIAQENTWLNPALSVDFTNRQYNIELNERAGVILHKGLRALVLEHYEDIGYSYDVLGPEMAREASRTWDSPQATRLYRRVR